MTWGADFIQLLFGSVEDNDSKVDSEFVDFDFVRLFYVR